MLPLRVFQTIIEQQRVIRRLLRKGHSYQFKHSNWCEDTSNRNIKREEVSPNNSDTEDNETVTEDTPMEISISVTNLSEILIVRPPVLRSISDTEERRKCLVKFDRRAKNREKLMSMKRYSGFLKRPEILETVYSVESEDGNEGGKTGEGVHEKKDDTATKVTKTDESKVEVKPKMKLAMIKRRESETTEYDWSTES